MQTEVTIERIIYIGIDVHKDTSTAHMFGQLDDGMIDYEIGTIASGVGMGFDPPRYLSSGDEIECIVEGLGVLRNTVK